MFCLIDQGVHQKSQLYLQWHSVGNYVNLTIR